MAHSLFIIVSVPLPCNSVGTSSLLFSIFDGHSPARGARRWVAFWTPKYLPGWRPCEADSRGSRRGGGVWRRRDRGKPIFITRTQEYSIKSAARWLLGAPPFRHPFPSAIHDHHHQYRPIIYRPFIQADPMAWWHKGGIPGPHLRGLRPVLPPMSNQCISHQLTTSQLCFGSVTRTKIFEKSATNQRSRTTLIHVHLSGIWSSDAK